MLPIKITGILFTEKKLFVNKVGCGRYSNRFNL